VTFRYNCPGQPNNIDLQPGWSQVIRLYQPRSTSEISAYVAEIRSSVAVKPMELSTAPNQVQPATSGGDTS
jgi:hypothetical protein